MGRLGKIFLISILACFYGVVLLFIFNPDVCKEYDQFYIKKTINRYPERPRLPRNGRFTWEWDYVSEPRSCYSRRRVRILPKEVDQYMRKLF